MNKFCTYCGNALIEIVKESSRSFDAKTGDPLVEIDLRCPKYLVKTIFGYKKDYKHDCDYVYTRNINTGKKHRWTS